MERAIERWRALIGARAEQMDAAYARLGRTSADFWDRRARGFHRATHKNVSSDPLYQRVRAKVTPQLSVLDVGAGTGRFALALAPHARQVIAVEPNGAMLAYLHQELAATGLSNLLTLQSRWEDAPADVRADIVICSHVLYPLLEVGPFLAKLNAAGRQACYLYLRATQIDMLTAPLWRHFHGDERRLAPGYIHALDVLYEQGIYANVEVAGAPFVLSYATLQEAEDELLEQLILEDTARTRQELRGLLEDWLIAEDDSWHSPEQEFVSAILSWTPRP
ncbi:MAG TPA: class I SAM-dependent methyltransferase [Ktedonobacteraceae bacterium]|jgi:SAM-dependent methyltransferase